jgi:L-threonylcarbamoyladenylate synthase
VNLSSAYNYFQNAGTIGIIPTDTVYGLAARASDQEAVKRLYALKDRESKPGTVIASSIEQLVDLGLKRRYLKAVEDYWPAPLSVIIPCGPELSYLHLGKSGLAVRLPNNQELISLLEKVGPLLTSSANLPGETPASTIEVAQQYFKDKVDFYVDGGNLGSHEPSTIVRIVDDAIEVIRPGAFKIEDQS